jgi:Zn-dependent peptidase ImmA (M78 family)
MVEKLPPPESCDEVEERAAEVRTLIGQEESGPIRNLTSVVERAGVCLIPVIGLDGIDGLSAWVNGVPVIGLSPNVPGDRFRLTVGHELAHLLVHLRKTETTESEANRFASALLIPPSEFDALMPKTPQLRDFVSIKSSWGVSVAALVYRAHELSYIDDRRYRALQIQMAKWRKNEPAPFEPVPGQLLNRLVEVNGGVGVVAKNLGVNQNHLRQLCDWRRLRLA